MERARQVSQLFDLLGRRHALEILFKLHEDGGKMRSNRLRQDLGASPVTFSARLRELERAGLITRDSYLEVPPRVEYALSLKGRDIVAWLSGLTDGPRGTDAAPKHHALASGGADLPSVWAPMTWARRESTQSP